MPRKADQIAEASTLVLVEITDGAINVTPKGDGETVIYRCTDKANHPPKGRPCEVRWVVTGLQEGQRVRIEPKDDDGARMFGLPRELDVRHPDHSITSGYALDGSRTGKRWAYRIGLYGTGGTAPLQELDPEVIIKDYP